MSDMSALTLRIDKPVYGGAGLARHQGQVIFTPFTLPSELVTAGVTYARTSFAEARLASVLEPSPARVKPPCPYFGVCGGCHYQHAGYEAQLAIKRTILAETLARARLMDLPEIVTHASEPFGYRNRIRLHLDAGTSALGYRERASHRLLSVEVCPIATSDLEQALSALRAICAQQQCGRVFSAVELSSNHDGSELLLALWLRPGTAVSQAQPLLQNLCEALQALVPTLRGAGVHAPEPRNELEPRARSQGGSRTSRSSRTRMPAAGGGKLGDVDSGPLEEEPGHLIAAWGTPAMTYKAGGFAYRVSLGAFFQVTRTLVDRLAALATAERSGKVAWDLYAGVGLFSCLLARQFEQVIAVEGAPASAGDLKQNLAAPHQAVRTGTGDFLRRQLSAFTSPTRKPGARSAPQPNTPARPDFVLIDPPRAGLGAEGSRILSEIGPPSITYVSCDPATLARDLRVFVESGYKLQQLHLIDLFPQTFHLEAVAMLSLV